MTYFTASTDPVEKNTRFARELNLDYPILSDPEKKTAEKYNLLTKIRRVPFRWTFIIGKDGKILHIDKDVKPKGHGDVIVKKLEELKVEKK